MGLIPNDLINQVLERSDIVAVIGNYTALKKAGRNFKALCPFHTEKTSSFVVNPDKQIFHCFGCGAGGNAVGFIMRQEHLDFPSAVRFLADKAGIEIPETDSTSPQPSRQLRDEVFKVNSLAVNFFHETLLSSREPAVHSAREYLKGRGINLDVVKKFQLGFALNEWDVLLKFLKSKGISEELILKAGLAIAREGKSGCYDRFRGRIVFPIFDIQNRPVAFGARAMQNDDGAKYINSPETPVYTKGQHMFGLQLTKTAAGQLDRMIVVEGYMDMMIPFIHGVENIAASLGTALTPEQIRLIRRYTPNVVMLFDTDPAGQSAIVRSLDLLIEEGMNVTVATLAEGQDPDSFIRQYGQDAFDKRIRAAQSVLDFKYDWLTAQYDPSTVEGKSKISQALLSTIAKYQNEVAKYELTRQLSQKLNIPEGVLLKDSAKSSTGKISPKPAGVVMKATPGGRAVEELLLTIFLKDPAWVVSAKEAISPDDFSDLLMRSVAHELWHLGEEHSEWTVNDLLTRLPDEKAQSLVTRLISNEEAKLGEVLRVFQDCIAYVQKERQKKLRLQLMEAIAQAEANRNEEELQELKEKFNQLIQSS